jgi:hypothetical protein
VSRPAALPRTLEGVLFGLLFGLAAALTLHDIPSNDYWWHLRTGQLIAETGAVPRSDPYTFTVPGARWIDVHWRFQLLLLGVYRLGGHAGAVLLECVLVSACVALLAPIGYRRERSALSVAALALLLVLACFRFMPRPELLTFVLLAAVLLLLDRFERTGDAWVYAVVPVQLVWTNVHGLFAVGVAVCGIHLAGELLRPLGDPAAGLRVGRVRRLAAVTALAALAALANPNGLDGALYPLEQLGMVGGSASRDFFGSVNRELQPSLAALPGPALAAFLGLAALSLLALVGNWRTTPPSDGLLWVAFFWLGIGAVRNAALFAIVATPLLVRNANAWLDRRPAGGRWQRPAALALVALLALACVDAARGGLHARVHRTYRAPGLGVSELSFPHGAVDWLDRFRPPGPVAHDMRDGGYLLWRLYPDYRSMLDGRLEVFGAETFRRLSLDGPAALERLDAEYAFGAVLQRQGIGQADAMLGHLIADPDWRLVFVDDVAALFVRERIAREAGFAALDLSAPDLFPPLGGGRSAEDAARVHVRAGFFAAVGRFDRALAVWEEGLARFPELERGREVRKLLRARLRPAHAPGKQAGTP